MKDIFTPCPEPPLKIYIYKKAPYHVLAETELCVTCWRYSVPWVHKQVEALANQDRLLC